MCKEDFKRRHTSYIPLHGHSTFSFGDGITKIDDLIKRTKEIGSNSIALTEHGNMSSFLRFYKAAKAEGIKPILGCELYLNDSYFLDKDRFLEAKRKKKADNTEEIVEEIEEKDKTVEEDAGDYDDTKNSHLLIYARNYEGLKNLTYLSNKGFMNFYRKPLVSTEMVYNHLDDNNIVTTGCLNSEFSKMILMNQEDQIEKILKKYKDKFGENFYLEIQINDLEEQNFVNEFYYKISPKIGVKPVFALDYHYAKPEDWYLQYMLYTIKRRENVKSYPPEKWFYGVRNLYIKEIDEVYKMAEKNKLDLKFLESAIDSTFEIRDKTDISVPMYEDKYPKFTLSEETSVSLFEEKLEKKWQEKIKSGLIPNDKIKEYRERLEYELKIIKDKKIVDYFLILDDLIGHVYEIGGATGAGRGSCGGSLVLFVFGITKVDPVKYGLIFERFINPSRMDPPDVDLDVSSKAHKHVEEYLKNKYGEDKVCHISNFIKFGPKTIVKDICRIYELDYVLTNRLTGLFDFYGLDTIEEELDKALEICKKLGDNDLIKFINQNYDLFCKFGNKMKSMIRQVGRHASGILISNKALVDSEIPLFRNKGEIVTGVQEGADEREITELGYLKLDILGLSAAEIINDCFKLIEKRYNLTHLEEKLLLSDFDDEKVYEEFQKGNCRDIFQFGSDNMVELIKNTVPKNIYDLCAVNALFRPAIINSGGISEFLKNRSNPEAAKTAFHSKHPKLWEVLEETSGTIAYQEQVMFILQKIGSFSLAEADKARKILKLLHKKNQTKDNDFVKLLDQFKTEARKNGMKPDDVDWLLDILAKYSQYSFNKCLSGNMNVVTPNGLKNIKKFKKGDEVLSFDSKKKNVYTAKVKNIHKNGKKKLYRIKTSNGNYIEATMDHKFMTKDGKMKTLKQILDKNLEIINI
jgi:DNA polymerase-3 subunit alpha